ncbi:MAG: L,D-transpeptidase family protein [Mucilaginibacter sp.]
MNGLINLGYKVIIISFFIIIAKSEVTIAQSRDSLISVEVQHQLNSGELNLNYPKTVTRLYLQQKFKPIWIKNQGGEGVAWQAMLLIDCVKQFGLSHADYHPKDLLYDQLHDILDIQKKVSISKQARFEIILTDAIVTFINHLHYGKLNPYFTADQIDAGNINGFNTEIALINALKEKDFMTAVAKVQPKSKEYEDLQYHMHRLTGLLQGDCYEIPEADIRQMAINMERLRWANIEGNDYIHINIPSYTLMFHQPDTTYLFKVIVGKPGNPTPTLASEIKYFSTAPEWNVPAKIFRKELIPKAIRNAGYLENNNFSLYNKKGQYITPTVANLKQISQNPAGYYARQASGCDNALGQVVFRFDNPFSVYLHDTPEQQLFNKNDRAFSHGCIRVEQALKLADLILINDGGANKIQAMRQAATAYKKQSFTLKKALPIKITYLTCIVQGGVLTKFKDVYDLDNSLEMALYGVELPLTTMK